MEFYNVGSKLSTQNMVGHTDAHKNNLDVNVSWLNYTRTRSVTKPNGKVGARS